MSKQPFVSVIVPVYNDSKRLRSCLEALEKQTYPRSGFEVIVVDNASEEDIHAVTRLFEKVFYCHESRIGPAAARNKGVRACKGDVIAFTDSDCLPAADWIEKGSQALLEVSGCGIAAGKIETSFENPLRPTAVELFNRNYFKQEQLVKEEHFAATANVFTFRWVFEKAGYFNERFDVPSNEDREWTERVYRAGFGIIYAEDAVVRHPARRTLRELYKKITEARTGYFYYENLKHGAAQSRAVSLIARELIGVFKPPFRSALRTMKSFKGFSTKVKLYFVILFAYYARLWVGIRLKLGWRPRRRIRRGK